MPSLKSPYLEVKSPKRKISSLFYYDLTNKYTVNVAGDFEAGLAVFGGLILLILFISLAPPVLRFVWTNLA